MDDKAVVGPGWFQAYEIWMVRRVPQPVSPLIGESSGAQWWTHVNAGGYLPTARAFVGAALDLGTAGGDGAAAGSGPRSSSSAPGGGVSM